ncbi:OLE1 [Symbiodinium sp. KB8]|nr:OLE1 [Symbiodinium sp. KB8]
MHPIHVPLLTITPILAIIGILTADFVWQTYAFAVFYYFFTGFGITAGYHRLFAHRCYDAHWTIRWLMMLMGSGAVEGSVRWWSRDHRAHHKYVDTEKDPYSSKGGFFYAHMGWMLVRQDKERIGKTSIKDLEEDPMIVFQHRNYPWFGERRILLRPGPLANRIHAALANAALQSPIPISAALGMGIVLPTVVCGLGWGDWYGGYFIAAVARLVFVHHSTFCVNSLAHWAGDQGFSDAHTARDSVITALVTLGEGYHNFHHEFPSDYRNAILWWQYDPTKWLIAALSFFGLTYNLKTFDSNLIAMNQVQMKAKTVEWGRDATALEAMDMAEMSRRVKEEGKSLLVVDGFCVDISGFADEHPGGAGYIRGAIGKDVTDAMRGGVYKHSNAALNLTASRRIGIVTDSPSFCVSSEALRAAAIMAAKKPRSD